MILDIVSRYVPGFTLARRSAQIARGLLAQAIASQGIARSQMAVHADRGASMTQPPGG